MSSDCQRVPVVKRTKNKDIWREDDEGVRSLCSGDGSEINPADHTGVITQPDTSFCSMASSVCGRAFVAWDVGLACG